MFHGLDGKPKAGSYSRYGTTDQTMKGFNRMIATMGLENVPFRHKRADAAITYQEWFCKADVAVKRNTSAYCAV